jgi:hypothetical protein
MLRVSPAFILRGPGNERTVMGNAAIGEELAGIDELEERYELNASESDDEDEYDEEDDEDEYDEEGDEDEENIEDEDDEDEEDDDDEFE